MKRTVILAFAGLAMAACATPPPRVVLTPEQEAANRAISSTPIKPQAISPEDEAAYRATVDPAVLRQLEGHVPTAEDQAAAQAHAQAAALEAQREAACRQQAALVYALNSRGYSPWAVANQAVSTAVYLQQCLNGF
jgi:hypothetical protein